LTDASILGPTRLSVWPPLPPGAYLGGSAGPAPYPLEDPRCRLFGWGRQALFAGVRSLGLGPGDEVLAPAYHHGSEVEALTRAGLACRFYDATDSLAPDPETLDRLLGPRVRALFLIHYLGLPQDSARWRAWSDERGLMLLEDAAQAWLSSVAGRPAGSFGDLGIFCLYKTVGLPEGAAVVSRLPPDDPGVDRRLGLGQVARRHAAWLAQRSRLAATAASTVARRSALYDPERDFALRPEGDRPWRSVPALLRRLDYRQIAERRLGNYRRLLEALGDQVPEPFRRPADGASPWAFPVRTSEKAALLERLSRSGVKGADFWSVPHPSLPGTGFEQAAALRSSVVCLPVHQELGARDLDRIVRATRG
jgi:dTDP-4-amino-4,6-dideoxygalactose transaminase